MSFSPGALGLGKAKYAGLTTNAVGATTTGARCVTWFAPVTVRSQLPPPPFEATGLTVNGPGPDAGLTVTMPWHCDASIVNGAAPPDTGSACAGAVGPLNANPPTTSGGTLTTTDTSPRSPLLELTRIVQMPPAVALAIGVTVNELGEERLTRANVEHSDASIVYGGVPPLTVNVFCGLVELANVSSVGLTVSDGGGGGAVGGGTGGLLGEVE